MQRMADKDIGCSYKAGSEAEYRLARSAILCCEGNLIHLRCKARSGCSQAASQTMLRRCYDGIDVGAQNRNIEAEGSKGVQRGPVWYCVRQKISCEQRLCPSILLSRTLPSVMRRSRMLAASGSLVCLHSGRSPLALPSAAQHILAPLLQAHRPVRTLSALRAPLHTRPSACPASARSGREAQWHSSSAGELATFSGTSGYETHVQSGPIRPLRDHMVRHHLVESETRRPSNRVPEQSCGFGTLASFCAPVASSRETCVRALAPGQDPRPPVEDLHRGNWQLRSGLMQQILSARSVPGTTRVDRH
ncbi:uncharacterized protein M421DRAFT_94643 [Didymella exigua CBS 183.55]|uniref:Uncharacterized protein n=1 Tax=Didymella exigua CBS 183.55 TaxID=1150837 RepID=A0A6A5REN6_9PLEO|nr:uncharacterized protein M421DRAFT_94643 [Didymella exigua CBS 183.55]KAF1925564.1 hypothetical protein M421DRAFT_94643 [Didymella exigua CBS 183.55]